MRKMDLIDVVDRVVFGICTTQEHLEKMATLKPGKTFQDFVGAYNQGIDAAREARPEKGCLDYQIVASYLEPVIAMKDVETDEDERFTAF